MSSVTAGRVSVAPGAIEAELARIWHDTAALDAQQKGQNEKAGETSPRVRAVLSNVVIFSVGTKSPAIDSLITELLIAHPSRFFIVEFDVSSTGDRLETFLSSRCALAASGKHVCSEEIYIHTPVGASDLVPNLLLSLFRADVPAIVVFPNGLHEDTIGNVEHRHAFQELVRKVGRVCDKVVFDGEDSANYHLLVTMLRVALDSPDLSADDADFRLLRDLHWRRLERWRNLIAEQFESATGPDLAGRIRTITLAGGWNIETLGRGVVPADALILSGWCAARLGFNVAGRWDAKSSQSAGLEVSGFCTEICGESRVLLRFLPDADAPKNTISRVEFGFAGADSRITAELKISRDGKSRTGLISWNDVVTGSVSTRQVPFPYRGVADLFIGEISTSQMYRLFEESVRSGEAIRKCLTK